MTDDIMGRLQLTGHGETWQNNLCEQLSFSPLFADLEWAELKVLAQAMQGSRVAAGTTIFSEGEPGSYLCFVISGQIDIIKENQAGERKVVATVTPGRTVGEMAVIDGERRSATCIAAKESLLGVLTRTNFDLLMHHHPGVSSKLLLRLARMMSQRLRAASGQLVDYLDH